MPNHTLFISDLHLDPNTPHLTQLFFNFLKEYATKADALYILGDFFEVWIGDDNLTEFNWEIISALKTITEQHIPVYIMRGNRDFLLGEAFTKKAGCTFLNDPSIINLYGNSILLSHGDMFCTDDKLHQLFRHYAYNPRYNQWFLKLPLSIRRYLAKQARQLSQKRTQRLPKKIMDVNAAKVIEVIQQYSVNQLIHGHTHQPAIHQLVIGQQPATRAVLAAWHERGNMLIYREDGTQELAYF